MNISVQYLGVLDNPQNKKKNNEKASNPAEKKKAYKGISQKY